MRITGFIRCEQCKKLHTVSGAVTAVNGRCICGYDIRAQAFNKGKKVK
jgi:hypothetical protein